jgi:hypothetical protein
MSEPHENRQDYDEQLAALSQADADFQQKSRRFFEIEHRLYMFMKRTDPERFGAWLRHYTPSGREARGNAQVFINYTVPLYVAWLERVRAAYLREDT